MISATGKGSAAAALKAKPVFSLFGICLILFLPIPSFPAERLTIGVAANFIRPFKVLAQTFERIHFIPIDESFASSGNLYAQIIHGAPYDLLLSADRERPERLFQNGLADKPFVYAAGKVVLWGLHKDICSAGSWVEALRLPSLEKIAIANPQTAPYGLAALQALQTAGLWQVLQERLVFAQTVSQAFQYAHTATAAAGFCAYSSVLSQEVRSGCWLPVDPAPDIIQSACILKRTQVRRAAEAFAAFLVSSEAERIRKQYGYR